MTKFQVVLPARLASTRLPEKLLQRVAGKSVLQHTYEAASQARCADDGVLVAVDDQRLADEVDSFGGRWLMTPADCASGTDRVAFVAKAITDAEIFVNVQSDEPEIDPDAIDAVAEALASDPAAEMATAGTPISQLEHLSDPGIVKIVMGDFAAAPIKPPPIDDPSQEAGGISGQGRVVSGKGRAIYFSRALVPFDRDGDPGDRLDNQPPIYWHHLGLYAYRREFLSWFAGSPPSLLETVEKLEQLRAVEAGKRIMVAAVGAAKSGIDTPEDLAAFRNRMES